MTDIKLSDILSKAEVKTLKSSGITISEDKFEKTQQLQFGEDAQNAMRDFHNKNILLETLLLTLGQDSQKVSLSNYAISDEHVREDGLLMKRYIVNYNIE